MSDTNMSNTILKEYLQDTTCFCFPYVIPVCKRLIDPVYEKLHRRLCDMTLTGYSIFRYKSGWITFYYRSRTGHLYTDPNPFPIIHFDEVMNGIKDNKEPKAMYNYNALLDLKEKVINKYESEYV